MPRQTVDAVLPFGESDKVFVPGEYASEILNFYLDRDGTLRSINGVAPYVPDYGSGYPGYGNFHGIFHTVVENGTRDILLVRNGSEMWAQAGWNQDWEIVETGLNDDPGAKYPDLFFEFNGRVVWSNGTDNPRVYDGYVVVPMGYDHPPGSPTIWGPAPAGDPVYRNAGGFSHPGKIGTVGDELSGQDGSLLAGQWVYWVQFEDLKGDLSPLSAASSPVILRTERTATVADDPDAIWRKDANAVKLNHHSVVLDDLTRQFFVSDIDRGPQGTVARRVYRSKDLNRNPRIPYLLVRIPDNVTRSYPDNKSDSSLILPESSPLPTPAFKVGCVHQGRAVIGNTSSVPNLVHISRPNMLTFDESAWCLVGDGPEVTGAASYNGELYVWTATSTYKIQIADGAPIAVLFSSEIGCVAPRSIVATGWGSLVWLGQDGLYELSGSTVGPVKPSKGTSLQRLASGAPGRAQGVWDAGSKEYLLFYPRVGGRVCDQALAYDGEGFRRRDYGIDFQAVATTRDTRRLILGGGDGNLFALNRESASFDSPQRTYRYRTSWMGIDATKRRKFSCNTLYLGFVEYEGASVTIRAYVNGRKSSSPAWEKTFTARPDDWIAPTSNPPWGTLATASIGVNPLSAPKTFWLRYDCNLRNVDCFSFELESTGKIALIGWGADLVPLDQGPRTTRTGAQ